MKIYIIFLFILFLSKKNFYFLFMNLLSTELEFLQIFNFILFITLIIKIYNLKIINQKIKIISK